MLFNRQSFKWKKHKVEGERCKYSAKIFYNRGDFEQIFLISICTDILSWSGKYCKKIFFSVAQTFDPLTCQRWRTPQSHTKLGVMF